MPISGALEVTIKINTFLFEAKTVENGLKQFDIETGNQTVTVKVNPKLFRKLQEANANYSQWVADKGWEAWRSH